MVRTRAASGLERLTGRLVELGAARQPLYGAEFELLFDGLHTEVCSNNSRTPLTPEVLALVRSWVAAVAASESDNPRVESMLCVLAHGEVLLTPDETAALFRVDRGTQISSPSCFSANAVLDEGMGFQDTLDALAGYNRALSFHQMGVSAVLRVLTAYSHALGDPRAHDVVARSHAAPLMAIIRSGMEMYRQLAAGTPRKWRQFRLVRRVLGGLVVRHMVFVLVKGLGQGLTACLVVNLCDQIMTDWSALPEAAWDEHRNNTYVFVFACVRALALSHGPDAAAHMLDHFVTEGHIAAAFGNQVANTTDPAVIEAFFHAVREVLGVVVCTPDDSKGWSGVLWFRLSALARARTHADKVAAVRRFARCADGLTKQDVDPYAVMGSCAPGSTEDCQICLEPIAAPDFSWRLARSCCLIHSHGACLFKWLRANPECFICHTPICVSNGRFTPIEYQALQEATD